MDKDNLPYYPNVIKIEFTQGCNRHCKFCGTQGIADTHFMEWPTLQKIVALVKTAKRDFRIELGMHGEPLMNPRAVAYIMYLHKELPRCPIQVITNGDYIRNGTVKIKDLLPYIQDLAMDMYDVYSYDEIKAYAKELKAQYPDVDVQMMQNGVSFYASKKRGYKRILLLPPIDLQTNLDVVSCTLSTHCGAGMDPTKVQIKKDKRCHMPFRQLAFRWDAKVCLCCDDFRGELPIVDAMAESITHFADVWWDSDFNALRRIIFHKGRVFSPCNKCNARGNRLGLLPDPIGKLTLRQPTKEGEQIWKECLASGPLVKIRKREWEE